MSRAKYSPEKQRAIMATFIEATTEIINDKGIEAVSIRNVASRAGYSSATMYLYFDDISQLIALASVSYLKDYVSEISDKMMEYEDLKDRYLYTWEAFCRHALRNAPIFMQLFFSRHANNLDDIVKKYYSIFPNELESISSTALSMLMSGSLFIRNMSVLKPYALQAGFSETKTGIINEMTICFFRQYLETACEKDMSESEKQLHIERFIRGISYLL